MTNYELRNVRNFEGKNNAPETYAIRMISYDHISPEFILKIGRDRCGFVRRQLLEFVRQP